MRTWDFFIAHAGDDRGAAEELYDLLQPCKVFLDSKTLIPGDNWNQVLPQAQRDSCVTVVLISSKTDQAHYQCEEIIAAIEDSKNDTGRRFIPVFLENVAKTPYGLRSKQSLYISREGSLKAIAAKLKETLARHYGSSDNRLVAALSESLKFQQKLLSAIAKLDHEDLLTDVIVPLLSVIHPGRVEFLDLSTAKGLLSISTDHLKRQHILCLQLKCISSDVSSKQFREGFAELQRLRQSGTIREGGQEVIIHEAWLLTVSPFFDKSSFSRLIQEMDREGIKFISGEELVSLAVDNIPEVASKLSKYSSAEIIRLISALSKHNEGRAFGLATDRNITEFYVTAALSPYAKRAYAAIRGEISIRDYEIIKDFRVGKILLIPDLFLTVDEAKKLIHKRVVDQLTKGILDRFDVGIEVRLVNSLSDLRKNFISYSYFGVHDFPNLSRFILKLRDGKDPVSRYLKDQFSPNIQAAISDYDGNRVLPQVFTLTLLDEMNALIEKPSFFQEQHFSRIRLSDGTKLLLGYKDRRALTPLINRLVLQEAYPRDINPNDYAELDETSITVRINFEQTLRNLVEDTRSAVENCPSVLTVDASAVRKAWRQLELTEEFIRISSTHFGVIVSETPEDESYASAPVRVRIPDPEHLLHLDKVLLVEGPPGCGKTTLLKMLAINLLGADRRVCYLPCFNIPPNFKPSSLQELAKSFSEGSEVSENEFKNTILIVDGLDEAPFDLSQIILSGLQKFAHIIVSTRAAFPTKLRSEFFRIELSPFTNEERDLFFQKWFSSDHHLIDIAQELISRYPDIDAHTRLPLIATILVVLLQNEVVPKTRAEIYGFRLDLLLSRWDKLRGVRRLSVDNPDAKRRFLKHLAYHLHSTGRRRRIDLSELRDVYEGSLGEWGYNVIFEDILKDLIVGSGVLMEEQPLSYSFGHLTFQEHLVGEYLAQNYSVDKIMLLLDDDWWREPLNFYASIRGDISDVLDCALDGFSHLAYTKQLSVMAAYAPYTSPGAIASLRDYLRDLSKE